MATTAPSQPEPLLAIEGLEVRFPLPEGEIRAVRGVDLTVRRGEWLAMVGESGSGKSLTSLSIPGLTPAPGRITGGSIRFEGRELVGLDRAALRALRGDAISVIFQEPMTSLNPVYTVGFHLREALTSHRAHTAAQVRARSVELLGEVGIPNPETRLKVYPHQLSGGLGQRVMIACALAGNPHLLIADEPTTALDVTVEAQIMALLKELQERRSMAILFVTHDLGLVANHAHRVVVLYGGIVVETAPVKALFTAPRHPYTRALLRAMPTGTKGERLHPIEGTVPSPRDLGRGCPFASRCAERVAVCDRELPDWTNLGGDAGVRCHRVRADA